MCVLLPFYCNKHNFACLYIIVPFKCMCWHIYIFDYVKHWWPMHFSGITSQSWGFFFKKLHYLLIKSTYKTSYCNSYTSPTGYIISPIADNIPNWVLLIFSVSVVMTEKSQSGFSLGAVSCQDCFWYENYNFKKNLVSF